MLPARLGLSSLITFMLAACSPQAASVPVTTPSMDSPSHASADRAYSDILSRLGTLRHVNAGRTLVADQLEGWYDGSELILARATFEGMTGRSTTDFLYRNAEAQLAVERGPGKDEVRAYFAGISRESGGDAASLARMAAEVQSTLQDYNEGKDVRPPAQE
jgi:hypothetical protein